MGLEVNDNDQNNGQNNEQPRRDQQRPNPANEFNGRTQQQSAPRSAQTNNPNIRNLGRALPRAFGRNDVGEALNKMLTGFKDLLFGTNGNNAVDLSDFQVLGLDNVEAHTTLSAVVITYGIERDNTIFVAYFTNLIEASSAPLAPLSTDWNGRRFEVPQVAGDVLNDRYLDRVEEVVTAHYASTGRQVRLLDAGSNVIYSEVDAEKHADAMRQYAFYSTAALQSVLNQALNLEERFDMSWIVDGANLSVAVDFSGEPAKNAAGLPLRQDVSIRMSADIRGEDGVRREPMTVVGGALELIHIPSGSGENTNAFMTSRSNNDETQVVMPQFTINVLDTLGKQITPELLVGGLATATILSDNLFWVNGFQPKLVEGDDYRDIGALALLAGNPTKVDVKSNSFDRNDFLSYFGQLCRPDLAIAMNIAERGDLSWAHRLILEVAEGVDGAAAQFRELLDHVTLNHFSTRFAEAGGGDLVIDSGNRIIDGYYRDERGEMRDLNDWDLLKWMNFAGKNDVDTALAWQDTYDNLDEPMDVRVDKRLRILQDVLGASSVKVKGFSRQVYLPKTMMAALAFAVRDCGIVINKANATTNFGSSRPRGNARLASIGGHNLGSTLFAATTTRGNGNVNTRGVYTGRSTRGY